MPKDIPSTWTFEPLFFATQKKKKNFHHAESVEPTKNGMLRNERFLLQEHLFAFVLPFKHDCPWLHRNKNEIRVKACTI